MVLIDTKMRENIYVTVQTLLIINKVLTNELGTTFQFILITLTSTEKWWLKQIHMLPINPWVVF